MKCWILGSLFLGLASTPLMAQQTAQQVESSWLRLNDSVFVCRYELSWNGYRAFLEAQKKPEPYLPVESLTSMPEAFSLPPKRWERADRTQYPAEGISWEAAQAYCAWLTAAYLADPLASEKKIRFRLPTVQEWRLAYAAMPDAPYPWYGREPVLPDGSFAANLRYRDLASGAFVYEVDGFLMTAPIGSFPPNRLGLYDMVGNVGEMVSERGQCLGGHWDVQWEQSGVLEALPCAHPDPRFGFRWVAVIQK